MKTSELIGPALDWAVAKCEGAPDETLDALTWKCTAHPSHCYDFSTDWAQGGPIIEREKISLTAWTIGPDSRNPEYGYDASVGVEESAKFGTGPTPLIAAMRCFVASKLGDEVDVPEGLK